MAAGSLGLFGPERRCSAVLVCQSVLLDVSGGGAIGSATDSSVINDLIAKVLVPVLQVTARGAGIEPEIFGGFSCFSLFGNALFSPRLYKRHTQSLYFTRSNYLDAQPKDKN